MQRPCPHCRRLLDLPAGAVGRYVRCPACRGKFPVVAVEASFDETALAWLIEDAEADAQARERRLRETVRARRAPVG